MFIVTLPTLIEQLPWWTYTADNPSCTPELNGDGDDDDVDNGGDDDDDYDDDDKNCWRDQGSTYILWEDAIYLAILLSTPTF